MAYKYIVNRILLYLAIKFIARPTIDKVFISKKVVSATHESRKAIHSFGILHGDLHEGNILVVDEEVRVIHLTLVP